MKPNNETFTNLKEKRLERLVASKAHLAALIDTTHSFTQELIASEENGFIDGTRELQGDLITFAQSLEDAYKYTCNQIDSATMTDTVQETPPILTVNRTINTGSVSMKTPHQR
jgi:hypothetical protein